MALAIAVSLLATCRCAPAPSPDGTAQPSGTATPTPAGTFEIVLEGKVYDSTTGEPVADATVRYYVVASYFSEIQEGRPNATATDAEGHFRLPMIVHDTDSIQIHVEAPEYTPYEAKIDLLGDRTLDIGLTPQLSRRSS